MVDGRAKSDGQTKLAAPKMSANFVAQTLRGVLRHADFINALPGIVSQSTRTGLVLQRFTDFRPYRTT